MCLGNVWNEAQRLLAMFSGDLGRRMGGREMRRHVLFHFTPFSVLFFSEPSAFVTEFLVLF